MYKTKYSYSIGVVSIIKKLLVPTLPINNAHTTSIENDYSCHETFNGGGVRAQIYPYHEHTGLYAWFSELRGPYVLKRTIELNQH